MNIQRLNHAVLYVRNAEQSAEFYRSVLGFEVVILDPGGAYAFLRAPGSDNHHDVAFFSVGTQAGGPTTPGTVGLYHIAWEVPTVEDLQDARQQLVEAGAFLGESDHGVNKSVYARDPDGLEFEVTYVLPAAEWGDEEHQAIVRPLDLDAERRRDEGRRAARSAS
jgi:catechol-2,3-dioxygenase